MEYVDRVLPKLCHAAASMPVRAQARLAKIWAKYCPDQLQALLSACQQQITLQVLLDEESVRENEHIISVTKVLKVRNEEYFGDEQILYLLTSDSFLCQHYGQRVGTSFMSSAVARARGKRGCHWVYRGRGGSVHVQLAATAAYAKIR